eukprot:482202_1
MIQQLILQYDLQYGPTRSPLRNGQTAAPTTPSNNPSINPSNYPTAGPTQFPTITPSNILTINPTIRPSNYPTDQPTMRPTRSPLRDGQTAAPSNNPSINPSNYPTITPSNEPSAGPTRDPLSDGRTADPTQSPTAFPSTAPTAWRECIDEGIKLNGTGSIQISMMISAVSREIEIKLIAPKNAWFGVGFGGNTMNRTRLALTVSSVDGIMRMKPRRLEDHVEGAILSDALDTIDTTMEIGNNRVITLVTSWTMDGWFDFSDFFVGCAM